MQRTWRVKRGQTRIFRPWVNPWLFDALLGIGYRILKGVAYKSGPCATMIVAKADINRAAARGAHGDRGEEQTHPTPQAEAKVRVQIANSFRAFFILFHVFYLIFSGGGDVLRIPLLSCWRDGGCCVSTLFTYYSR